VSDASTTWSVTLRSGSTAQALSQGLPAAPTGVAAACTGLLLSPKANVTWSAVTHATSYAVFQSSTSSTSGFSQVASGIVTTSWTSSALGTGTFWFRVVAYDGTNWAGPQSSSSNSITVIINVSCT